MSNKVFVPKILSIFEHTLYFENTAMENQIPRRWPVDTFQCTAQYTLSVKLSAFTVWRHTWWKNWVNCAVLTGNSASLGTVLSSRLSHRKLRSSPRWHHPEAHPFLAIHSADEHRICSFSKTNSYSTFYAFFSDNIMADAASKQQTKALFMYPPQSHAQEHTQNCQKTKWQTWWETCAVPETVQFSFSCSIFFYTVKLHSLTESVWGS